MPVECWSWQLWGSSAWAVIAINSEESQALVDGVLTLGVLWLHHCREQSNGRRMVEGLRMILPRGKSAVTAARLAWMHPRAATWELYELDERTEELYARDVGDQGNLDSHLVHAPTPPPRMSVSARAIQRVRALLPADVAGQMEIVFRSGSEVGLLWNGLEFARIRTSVAENSFARIGGNSVRLRSQRHIANGRVRAQAAGNGRAVDSAPAHHWRQAGYTLSTAAGALA